MSEITTTTITTTTPAPAQKKKAPGLTFKRYFTKAGVSPYDELEWELRLAQITDSQGGIIFEQKDVEVPKDWSMTATNIVASKYLHGPLETPERETGVRQLVTPRRRDHSRLGHRGRLLPQRGRRGHLPRRARAPAPAAEGGIQFAGVVQRAAAIASSPTRTRRTGTGTRRRRAWNTARSATRIRSARPASSTRCTIRSTPFSTLAKTEGMLFKWGSGTGTNLSPLRSSTESLSGGGTASGPLSFMKGFDAFAGVIKSGGKTRRAAKMVILNIDHPDMVDFIECKQKEEAKAWAPGRSRLRRQRPRQRGLLVHLLPERQQLGARDRRLHVRGAAR